METEFKVKEVAFEEQKSVQEIEEQLLKEHDEKHGLSSEETPVETTVVAPDGTQEKIESPEVQAKELEDTDVLTYLKNRYNKKSTQLMICFKREMRRRNYPKTCLRS